jgi:hypothetical protein
MHMDLFICSKCGANLIDAGIEEVTVGGVSETDIRYKNKEAIIGSTMTHDFDEQWVLCGSCGAEMHDRTAADINQAYENDLSHVRDEEDEAEPIEIKIRFSGEFSIAQSGLTKEQAIKDTKAEWLKAKGQIEDMDYITDITEISEPEPEPEVQP